jgi:hypothetical protein
VEKKHREDTIKLQEREVSPEKDEQIIRVQKALLNESNHIAEKLREEVKHMRQLRDDATHTLEKAEFNREESSMQLRARAATSEADRLALEHRLLNTLG